MDNKTEQKVAMHLFLSGSNLQCFAEVVYLVGQFFEGDTTKTSQWLETPNPLLGNMSPLNMLVIGHTKKLLGFVKTSLAENKVSLPPVQPRIPATIIANKAQCKKCNDIIESKHRHDFISCKCGAISVDGGHDYLRRCGNPEDIEDLSVVHAR